MAPVLLVGFFLVILITYRIYGICVQVKLIRKENDESK